VHRKEICVKKPTVIYIAGERQHAGKTVASLGIISALCKIIDPNDIGYFKPVGQEMITLDSGERIDKDVRIVQEFTGLNMPNLSLLSPVRVGSGVTKDYLACDHPRKRTAAYEKAIAQTMEHLGRKKLIIAEGTGHPGVGSVVGLSNARVSNLLNAKILYLVGGGIGKPLDELEVDLSYFSHKNCNVAGILFNKILPKKTDSMKSVVSEAVIHRIFPEWNPPLKVFGYMPQVKYLNHPSMELISDSFGTCRTLNPENPERWRRPCRQVNIVSQGSESFIAEEHLKIRDIAVVGAGSHRRLKRILDFDRHPQNDRLGGLILNCANDKMPDAEAVSMIEQSGIPTLIVPDDAGAVDKTLYKCFVNTKLQLYDQQKHKEIEELFTEHFDAERFVRSAGL
jgi:dethiobiotin synthetase